VLAVIGVSGYFLLLACFLASQSFEHSNKLIFLICCFESLKESLNVAQQQQQQQQHQWMEWKRIKLLVGILSRVMYATQHLPWWSFYKQWQQAASKESKAWGVELEWINSLISYREQHLIFFAFALGNKLNCAGQFLLLHCWIIIFQFLCISITFQCESGKHNARRGHVDRVTREKTHHCGNHLQKLSWIISILFRVVFFGFMLVAGALHPPVGLLAVLLMMMMISPFVCDQKRIIKLRQNHDEKAKVASVFLRKLLAAAACLHVWIISLPYHVIISHT